MIQKIEVNQNYQITQTEIKSIINNFDSINQYIAKGTRNSIKKTTLESGKIATIKSFKIPNIINKFVYRFFRKSKAQRSYEYAENLINSGFKTP
ncbi:MAG: Kdo domain containing protein, partial [Algoriella sp.]